MELFAYLFSRFENWPYSRYGEQELKAQCYFLFSRESVVAHPRISKLDLLILAEKI
jgi:hypothetical protein